MRVLLMLAVLGWVAAVLIALTQFASPTPERIAVAQSTVQSIVQDQAQSRQECLADSTRPSGVSDNAFCGPPLRASDLRVDDYLHPKPFSLARYGANGMVGVSDAAAALVFLFGATFIGAEWSSRSIVALLFWETRRIRVMGAKLAVVAAASVVIGVLAQAAWLAAAGLLQAVAGDRGGLPPEFWGRLAGTESRGMMLIVLAGLLGFGLTNLVRNTGAALGIGLAYFAGVETAVRSLRPAWQPWLLTNNAAGLVAPGGIQGYTYRDAIDARGDTVTTSVAHILSNLHSGVFLAAVTVVVVAVSVALFVRRDLH